MKFRIVIWNSQSPHDAAPGLLAWVGAGETGVMLKEIINGAVIHGWSKKAASKAAGGDDVASVEPCYRGTVSAVRAVVGSDVQLDRVDQRELTTDGYLRSTAGGDGSRLYVLDTGINNALLDFGARATRPFTASGLGSGDDNHGHGTKMASIAAGNARGIGFATNIISIKIADATAGGQVNVDSNKVLEGLNYVVQQQTGVVNLSNAVSRSASSPDIVSLRTAVNNLTSAGFVVVAAAGNDANGTSGGPITGTYVQSPAEVPAAFTVAATTHANGFADARLLASNYGPEVDFFAPGTLQSPNHLGQLGVDSGSSGAAALVSGTVAAARGYRPANTYQQSLDLVVSRTRTTPVANGNSPNAMGQLFTDLGTVEQTSLNLGSSPVTCGGQTTNVPWTVTASVSDPVGSTYIASLQVACSNVYGLGKGFANIRIQRFNFSGALAWTRTFADPDPTNANTNDYVTDLAVNGDNTRLLVALSTSDTTRIVAGTNHGLFMGTGVEAYGVMLETTNGGAEWSVRLGTSNIDLATTAFFSANPEYAYIGGQTMGSFTPNTPVSGYNDAFLFAGTVSSGSNLGMQQFHAPGSVIIRDGAVVGPHAVLVGATNADPNTGVPLPDYDELTIRQTNPVTYSIVQLAGSDDEIVEVSKGIATNTLFVSRFSRSIPGGANVARLSRLPDMASTLDSPVWTVTQQILGSQQSRMALTNEDVYWVAGPFLHKVSRREGLTAFSETLSGSTSRISLHAGESLWIPQGGDIKRRKGR